ncbi:MAG TPA: alanine racemase, partial [Rhizomicrobium sp.]|nr:alanine racemase [Rhizomicrobium sp.]
MSAPNLNADLVGIPGGRTKLQTPALVIDLDILERNIARMAEHARVRGIALRPHAKTHKSGELARRQIEAGALGICVAKLGEAEALAEAGVENILITSPVVTEKGIERLIALNARIGDLMATLDNAHVAARIDQAAKASGKKLKVLVDLDPGMSRTGIAMGDAAFALVE